MANALLGMASVVNDPHENFNVCVDRLDAMQGLCDSIFDRELDFCVLCSNASSALCSRAACRSISFLFQLDRLIFSCFGPEVLLCLCYKRVLKLAFENMVSTLAIFAILVFRCQLYVPTAA